MRCNICGCGVFLDVPGRPGARCAGCGGLERARVAALHIAELDPPPGARALHFAPERGLAKLIRARVGAGYRALDIAPENYPGESVERFDLCRDIFDLPEGGLDLIVHNHVLEHIECNYTVVLQRLARALTPRGIMLFSAPIIEGGYRDEIVDLPLAEKRERFGPMLHVRDFGRDALQRTLGMVFRIPVRYDLTARFAPEILREANIPERHWRKYTGASIFRVGRGDLR